MEIDFLIAKSKISNRHNISPIEVKSSKNYTISSLQKFKAKYDEQLHVPYVLHTGDLKEEDGILYLPVYMTMFNKNIIVSRNLFYGDRLSNSKEQASNPPALYYYLPSNIFRYIFSTLNFGASSSTT